MKLTGRQSKNVEIAPSRSAQEAPHSNPFQGARGKLYEQDIAFGRLQHQMNLSRAKELGKKNPMYKALKGMDKPFKRDKNAAIPMPTPRPDPSKPYKKPTVMTGEYSH